MNVAKQPQLLELLQACQYFQRRLNLYGVHLSIVGEFNPWVDGVRGFWRLNLEWDLELDEPQQLLVSDSEPKRGEQSPAPAEA